tara:strand:+ start:10117 stop:10737 length:621 start_codon:yes stop_codon:yes gene_type:complete
MSSKICKMIFRTAVASDLYKIVNIHIESFPNGIQTYMGDTYLRQKYYFLIMFSEVKLVCEINAEVVGFSFSSPKPDFKLKLSFKHYFQITLSLIKNISIVSKLFYGRLQLSFTKNLANSNQFLLESNIELGYIAVSKTKRSIGLGAKLISEFERIAKSKLGYNKILTRTHNERLTNFYIENKNALIQKRKSSSDSYTCTLLWKIKK